MTIIPVRAHFYLLTATLGLMNWPKPSCPISISSTRRTLYNIQQECKLSPCSAHKTPAALHRHFPRAASQEQDRRCCVPALDSRHKTDPTLASEEQDTRSCEPCVSHSRAQASRQPWWLGPHGALGRNSTASCLGSVCLGGIQRLGVSQRMLKTPTSFFLQSVCSLG